MKLISRTTFRVKASLLMLLALPLAACGGSRTESASVAKPAARPSAAAASTHAGHGSSQAVEMRLIQFKPKQISVPVGTEVTWTQSDAGFHTVTSGTVEQAVGGVTTKPDGKFRSERLATDQTFKFTFDQPGTYPYFCDIHPATMTGEVSVGG